MEDEVVINLATAKKKRKARKNRKPPTRVLSVRVLEEIFDYDDQEYLKKLVQRAINKRLQKHQEQGKPKKNFDKKAE